MKEFLYKLWIFLITRSFVYFLSFFSYHANLFNIKKIISIMLKRDMIKYIKFYNKEIFIFVILIILVFSGKIFIKYGISNSITDCIEIQSIKKDTIDKPISYIGTFILPLIASFQKISFLWLFFYEVLIFMIVNKNIQNYAKIIYNFYYYEYIITLTNGKEINLFSNKIKDIYNSDLPKKIFIKKINLSNEKYEEYIYFYN